MPVAIRLLMPAAAKRDQLIADIDERHENAARLVLVRPSEIETKNAAVKV